MVNLQEKKLMKVCPKYGNWSCTIVYEVYNYSLELTLNNVKFNDVINHFSADG